MLVDTHCHLFFDEFKNDIDGVISRANELGVTSFICVGTDISDSIESYKLAKKYKNIGHKFMGVSMDKLGAIYHLSMMERVYVYQIKNIVIMVYSVFINRLMIHMIILYKDATLMKKNVAILNGIKVNAKVVTRKLNLILKMLLLVLLLINQLI